MQSAGTSKTSSKYTLTSQSAEYSKYDDGETKRQTLKLSPSIFSCSHTWAPEIFPFTRNRDLQFLFFIRLEKVIRINVGCMTYIRVHFCCLTCRGRESDFSDSRMSWITHCRCGIEQCLFLNLLSLLLRRTLLSFCCVRCQNFNTHLSTWKYCNYPSLSLFSKAIRRSVKVSSPNRGGAWADYHWSNKNTALVNAKIRDFVCEVLCYSRLRWEVM